MALAALAGQKARGKKGAAPAGGEGCKEEGVWVWVWVWVRHTMSAFNWEQVVEFKTLGLCTSLCASH